MDIFQSLHDHQFGELHLKAEEATGLRAIVAIHDTRLGPALGGCRFLPYESEDAAILDALRLARGMTYKAAIAQLPLGGGKSVIVRPKGEFDRVALFAAFGQFVEDLKGRYITAEDSGTHVADMETIQTKTEHVTGLPTEKGGTGDPSPFTALGVRRGLEACVRFAMDKASLQDVHVVVLGVGNVGFHLCKELVELGAQVTVADVDAAKTTLAQKELGASVIAVEEALQAECDVLAPCALGGILNDTTIPKLRCRAIAGAANNQLEAPRHGRALVERGIVYAPDYVLNAGGLISVAQIVEGHDASRVREQTMQIFDTVLEILQRAAQTKRTPDALAEVIATERLQGRRE